MVERSYSLLIIIIIIIFPGLPSAVDRNALAIKDWDCKDALSWMLEQEEMAHCAIQLQKANWNGERLLSLEEDALKSIGLEDSELVC